MEESPFKGDVMKGKVALLTGGGSGIGLEIATQFGKHGASVAIMGRRRNVLDAAVFQLRSLGIPAVGFAGDVRKQEDARRVVEATVEHFGKLDILVNAAAGNFLVSAEDLSPNGFKTVMDIDSVGTFTMCHEALPYIKKDGEGRGSSGGFILNLSATLHYTASWYQVHASAAKAAVDALTRNLALEWGTDHDIRVNGIAPGPIGDTTGLDRLVPLEKDDKMKELMPLYKVGTKWDIAMAALYLASDAGKYINGSILPVDGGLWLSKPRYISKEAGRPKGVTPKYSLKPLVPRLSELLGVEVKMASDCIGEEVEKLVGGLPEGGVVLLENVRFYKEEEKNDPEFAKKLASLADLYVNDAFGTAHRAHASTEGVAKYLKPAVAGFLMQKELDYLVGAIANPKKPFAAIVGGSKVSSKIGVIESLLEKVDLLLLGGGMIFTFYKAQGHAVGSSLVEADKLDLANSLIEKAKAKGVSLLLPSDVVVADKFAADANSKIVPASAIPDGWMGLDIGPDSIKSFGEALDSTKTVIWNGPMGVFEFDKFAAGTETIAKKLAELSDKGVTTIIGGGDSVAAVEKVGLADKMSHISTGGGASLELLEGKTLPGVLALDEA